MLCDPAPFYGRVRENYPLPIAHSYLKIVKEDEKSNPNHRFKLLAECLSKLYPIPLCS